MFAALLKTKNKKNTCIRLRFESEKKHKLRLTSHFISPITFRNNEV